MFVCFSFCQPYQSLSSSKSDELRALYLEPIDSKVPMDIVEEEELERISGLLQRDNLVRGLGIVEHVYRLLHCTPGTMSMQLKPADKYHVSTNISTLTSLKTNSKLCMSVTQRFVRGSTAFNQVNSFHFVMRDDL